MGILSRFGDIMRANINELIADAEEKNAEKLLNQYLRDAREDFEQVKKETASIMAEEAAAKRRVDELLDQMARYEQYAVKAVQAGNDADALKFLEAKNQINPKLEEAKADYANAQKNSEQMRQLTKKLRDDIETAEGKMGELKAKLRMAESKEKMQKLGEKMGGSSLSGFDNLADSIQKRIDAADAAAALDAQLSGEVDLADLEAKYASGPSSSAQDELAALKAGLGGAPSAAASELEALKAKLNGG